MSRWGKVTSNSVSVQVDDSTRCAPQTEAAAVHAAQLQRMGELTGRLAQTGWL